jgi:hypothetical protein
MLWLFVATLSGAMFLSAPPPERSSSGETIVLPRPSRVEIDLLLRAPERRVRSTNPRLTKMLAMGARRSPTFAGLLAALDRSDVIVYIEPANNMPSKLDGRLLMLPTAHSYRYLRIQVRMDLPREDLIPLIGHELRHALEIADAPDVRDQAAMVSLYERIGKAAGPHSYDTAAARSAGKLVKMELIG